MKIGYFGGSFDPVHVGHLILAESCREALGLDRVVFVVAGAPPHKASRPLAAAAHRLAMVALAVAGNPSFSVDDRETRRQRLSFTIDTVRELRAERPADSLLWLIGANTLPELPVWREAPALLDLIDIATACRPGFDAEAALPGLEAAFGSDRVRRLRAHLVATPLVGLSSKEVRERVRDGRSLRYLVPGDVARYIAGAGLYHRTAADSPGDNSPRCTDFG